MEREQSQTNSRNGKGWLVRQNFLRLLQFVLHLSVPIFLIQRRDARPFPHVDAMSLRFHLQTTWRHCWCSVWRYDPVLRT